MVAKLNVLRPIQTLGLASKKAPVEEEEAIEYDVTNARWSRVGLGLGLN